ncbi:hypothetical protein K3495_g11806 [Podosphaera aphanis]|nr:hypothetical protein K3495_g11806 [Podosphaera aphanis]
MLKFGGGSVMIWGYMSWFGAGGMSPVFSRMNSEQLIGILSTCLVPTVEGVANRLFFNDRNHILFQQDNNIKHTARVIKNWLASTGIKTMKWSSQSPDLNPIEHLWCLVKRRLGEYQELPNSIYELMKRVDAVWKNIHENSCQTLIESMPSRVVAVIKASGDTMGKLLEKLMANQITKAAEKYNFLLDEQMGARPGRSTITVVELL